MEDVEQEYTETEDDDNDDYLDSVDTSPETLARTWRIFIRKLGEKYPGHEWHVRRLRQDIQKLTMFAANPIDNAVCRCNGVDLCVSCEVRLISEKPI